MNVLPVASSQAGTTRICVSSSGPPDSTTPDPLRVE